MEFDSAPAGGRAQVDHRIVDNAGSSRGRAVQLPLFAGTLTVYEVLLFTLLT